MQGNTCLYFTSSLSGIYHWFPEYSVRYMPFREAWILKSTMKQNPRAYRAFGLKEFACIDATCEAKVAIWAGIICRGAKLWEICLKAWFTGISTNREAKGGFPEVGNLVSLDPFGSGVEFASIDLHTPIQKSFSPAQKQWICSKVSGQISGDGCLNFWIFLCFGQDSNFERGEKENSRKSLW